MKKKVKIEEINEDDIPYLMSIDVLGKNWNSPEDEEAWKDL